jgi:hypothetical protein
MKKFQVSGFRFQVGKVRVSRVKDEESNAKFQVEDRINFRPET